MVPTSALPFSARDLFIAAHNSHVLAFENISRLSDMMSDNLCRLATGGGIRIRSLFTNSDETLLRAARPILLEGIANFVVRADLMDRGIILALEPLTERKTERALQAEFERLRPGLFGALLDHLVIGLRQLPDIRLTSLPRRPISRLGPWPVGSTASREYAANRQAAIDVALEHDVLARAVRALIGQRHRWEGTASELLDCLGGVEQIRNAKELSDGLRRIAPLLRAVGIDVGYSRSGAKRHDLHLENGLASKSCVICVTSVMTMMTQMTHTVSPANSDQTGAAARSGGASGHGHRFLWADAGMGMRLPSAG